MQKAWRVYMIREAWVEFQIEAETDGGDNERQCKIYCLQRNEYMEG